MYQAFPKKKKIKRTTADIWFSRYIRIRDAIYPGGRGPCFTCGKTVHWKYGGECGHFVKRGKPLTRFNEKNCHLQCHTCNCHNEGEEYKHGRAIDKKYGQGTADYLVNLGGIRGAKRSKFQENEIAKKYRLKAKELAKKKGIEL